MDVEAVLEPCRLSRPAPAKGKGKQRKRKRQSDAQQFRSANETAVRRIEAWESDDAVAAREGTFWLLSKRIDSTAQNQEVFGSIVQFAGDTLGPAAVAQGLTTPFPEVATAILLTGVTSPDHAQVFAHLDDHCQEHLTPHVVLLHSSTSRGIKGIFQGMHEQLIGGDRKKGSAALFSMKAIESWYLQELETEREKAQAKPPKQKGKASRKRRRVSASDDEAGPANVAVARPPVVLVLQDFESFKPADVARLVAICSTYRATVPILLVLGIASAPSIVHQTLPRSAITLLNTQTFRLRSSNDTLADLISQLLMSDLTLFKLGPRPLHELLKTFIYDDMSVFNFLRGLKLALHTHCYTSPLSWLLNDELPPNERLGKERLGHDQLECIRHLPSFQAFVESLPSAKKQQQLVGSDSALRSELPRLLGGLAAYHESFRRFVRLLHAFAMALPEDERFPRVLPSWYETCLKRDIGSSKAFQALLTNLSRAATARTLQQLLELAVDALSLNLVGVCETSQRVYADGVATAQGFLQLLTDLQDPAHVAALKAKSKPKEGAADGKRAKNLRAWSQSRLKREASPFEKARGDIVKWLEQLFSAHLRRAESVPLYEVFYFTQGQALRLEGRPRVALQTALAEPHRILGCDGGEEEEGEDDDEDPIDAILDSMPDTVILYKLHLSAGRLVNLADLLEAFASIVEPKGKQVSAEVYARFVQGVSELELLGFVNHTARKADHLVRLTSTHA